MSILKVPGAQLFYEVSGSGPLLILIPGASGIGESFRPLTHHLIPQYQVVIYDRRGFFSSPLDGPADPVHRLETDADDVRRLIESLSDQPAIVFDSSSGVIVALEVLICAPERVQTLVAHEPPAVFLLPDAASWLAFFDGVYETYREDGIPKAMQQFASGILGSVDLQVLEQVRREHINASIVSKTRYWMEYELRQYPRVQLDLVALAAHAERILLGGGYDSQDQLPYQPNQVLAEQLDFRVVDFPGGHLGFLSYPASFAKALMDALKDF
ncbi:alpha/beta hydrolase [Ktedonobacter sp. SOSP1-52]|uniref:alpha/beta fold hydrolase n=1 Tax=Ktedonobacter sp. SOSP1-52 TaxID=2778366 RepID=UPI001914DF15|nr:alpha/beta hydrolase [Ktedonobacter sp. SOSP1-52]GHO68077.1 alpha/beta hydrolase [Ktedonobacter sp. SOSP1-52]